VTEEVSQSLVDVADVEERFAADGRVPETPGLDRLFERRDGFFGRSGLDLGCLRLPESRCGLALRSHCSGLSICSLRLGSLSSILLCRLVGIEPRRQRLHF
jgi:hypothetical protein